MQQSDPPATPPPIVISAQPPPGMLVVKGNGWRVNAPYALVAFVVGALATRLLSTEQRLSEQARTIEVLAARCPPPIKPP